MKQKQYYPSRLCTGRRGLPVILTLLLQLLQLRCSGNAVVEGDMSAEGDGAPDEGSAPLEVLDAPPPDCEGGECDDPEACDGCIRCGDSICSPGEGCGDCPQDCGSCPPPCGNGACETGEDCASCPQDCGACLPTCGAAGGDTCTTLATTLCLGLPLLPSSDCEACCDRPDLPPIGPNSYQYIDRDDTEYWDGILGLTDRGAVICSQNRPDAVPPERWCRLISGDYMSADEIVSTIHNAFQVDAEKPYKIMIDELEEAYKDKLQAVATTMAASYPQYAGRWGAFIENEDPSCSPCYGTKEAAINALLQANAILVSELYVSRGAYCSHGSNYGERDVWLAGFFAGNLDTQKKFAWLVSQRALLGSSSQLSVIFIVVDGSVGTTDAYIFIDRQFYVWVTRSGFRPYLLSANGGAGAYKWQHINNLGEVAVSSSNRDNLFADSFNHYCVAGSTESRFPGPTFCN